MTEQVTRTRAVDVPPAVTVASLVSWWKAIVAVITLGFATGGALAITHHPAHVPAHLASPRTLRATPARS